LAEDCELFCTDAGDLLADDCELLSTDVCDLLAEACELPGAEDCVRCPVETWRRDAPWSEVAAGLLLFPADAGELFTVELSTLRLPFPWLTAGLESPLFCTELADLRVSPF
jgi:hypothetical protein